MSTSATPYWPGDTNPQYFQNLAYNSTTQILTLSPFGNSVNLTTSASGGSFSTITVSSIQGNVSFTGNATLVGTNTFTAPNVTASNTSTINVNLSTINGLQFPAAPVNPTVTTYGLLYNIPQRSLNGNPLSTLSTFNSPVYTFNDFWNYTGPVTFLTTWNGSGNTNNLRNNTATGPAAFYRQINISTSATLGQVGEILHFNNVNAALTGSYGPTSQPSTFQIRSSGGAGNAIPASVNVNGGSGFYTGGGAQANVTVWGPGQVIIQDYVDFYLDSGDPGASYGFGYASPVNAANNSNTEAVITYR